MPIANCFVSSDVRPMSVTQTTQLIESWAKEAAIVNVKDEMTVNVIACDAQYGKPCPVMAWLYLPSLWSDENIDRLQIGLAKSLSLTMGIPIGGVQVITTLVDMGMVVDGGDKVKG